MAVRPRAGAWQLTDTLTLYSSYGECRLPRQRIRELVPEKESNLPVVPLKCPDSLSWSRIASRK